MHKFDTKFQTVKMGSLCPVVRAASVICSKIIWSKTPIYQHCAVFFCSFCSFMLSACFWSGLQNKQIWFSWLLKEYDFSGGKIACQLLHSQGVHNCWVVRWIRTTWIASQPNITLNTSGAILSADLIRKLVLCVYCIVSEYESCKGSVYRTVFSYLKPSPHRVSFRSQ